MPRVDARLRRELLAVALGLMEVSWLALVMRAVLAFAGARDVPDSPIFFAALMLWGYAAYRAVARLQLASLYERMVMAAILIASLLAVLRLTIYAGYAALDFGWLAAPFAGLFDLRYFLSFDLTVVAFVLILMGRGVALAGAHLDSRSVGIRFRVSILLLAVAIAIFRPEQAAPPIVFGFFFVGLCAIALARTEEAGDESGTTSAFGPAWLGAIAGSGALVLLVAAGVASLLTGQNILAAVLFLEPLLAVVGVVVIFVFGVIYAVMQLLAPVLGPLVRLLIELWRRAALLLGQVAPEDIGGPPPPALSPEVLAALGGAKGMLTVAVFALLVLAILLVMHLTMGRRREAGEEHETVLSSDLVGSGLRGLLLAGQQRLGHLAERARQLGLSGLFAAFTIRRIYAQMAAQAARRGFPRAPAETPLEYRGALARAYPGGGESIERITQAYLGVRYGELPETVADLDRVRAAWEMLRAMPEISQR
jgi:hypothetical protein